MLITLGFYKRKPGLSIEEFRRIWSSEYGVLYRDNDEVARYLRRYVQHHLSPPGGVSQAFVGFDGFSEAWFESAADRNALHDTRYYQQVIKPMAAQFLDLQNSQFAAYDTQIYQVGGPPNLDDAQGRQL